MTKPQSCDANWLTKENVNMNLNAIEQLAIRWEKDARQYEQQVEEARRSGTPHDQMLSMMTALRQCAADLRHVMARLV